MILNKLVGAVSGEKIGKKKIEGTVVLIKKSLLDVPDVKATVFDNLHEFLGNGVSLQLISSENCDPTNGFRGKLGKSAYLKKWISVGSLKRGECAFKVTFEWEEQLGVPGAFVIRNNHGNQFFLKTLTLEDPSVGRIHFVCNSWIYPVVKYRYDRIFFRNKTYLPSKTPEALSKYRAQELMILRGDHATVGELQEWDRVYDYAYYNDLGDPDKNSTLVRQTLGGSRDFPYPRRGRTGGPVTKTDPKCERPPSTLSGPNGVYVPRDERFGHSKLSDFLAYGFKSVTQIIKPGLQTKFESFQDMLEIYAEQSSSKPSSLIKLIRESAPTRLLKEILRSDGERFLGFPMPHVIRENTYAWSSDEEFAREMLAGVNPIIIRRLEEFPPRSKLDPRIYGDQTSRISVEHIQESLDGFSVEKAIENKKLFILDHHDAFMPYLGLINKTSMRTYASRTVLFLQNDDTLKPLAIELSLPHPDGDAFGAVSKVYTPSSHEGSVQNSIWQMAKAYVAVNDSCFHQLISHWLYTHAVIEPFVIATNRQLSVLHPVHQLLLPHFRDTMTINALARQSLINAEGIIESTFFAGRYSIEISSVIYKSWAFTEQALPADLIKRGMAVKDSTSPNGLSLVIEDYPYAVDGLEIWFATKAWVEEYCTYYYKNDEMIREDSELQSWWKEIREEGHGDKKDETWWPKMQNREELIEACTTVIWTASALHAAVNFGQYPYGGYYPNRPTISQRLMPEEGTPQYDELRSNAENVFLKTFVGTGQAFVGISVIQILSRHASDEVYLGERDTPEWTSDTDVLQAFERFRLRLAEIENNINRRNNNKKFKNRAGPVKFPYTLLCPTSEEGLTAKGIPNSISI